MRKRFEVNPGLSITPIESVKLPLKSRDELPAILSGLQWIFSNSDLNEEIFRIIEKKIVSANNTTGRPGMDLWHVFVLATVRLGLDIDFDKLEDLANHHKLLRLILGVESIWNNKTFNYRTINDNVSLLDETTLKAINQHVANYGRLLINDNKQKKMKLKTDSYVLECNIHFPTDLSLTWDSLKKCISLIIKDKDLFILGGWRKYSLWQYELKMKYLKCTKTVFGGGKNKKIRVKYFTKDFLDVCNKISAKILFTRKQAALRGISISKLDYFHSMVEKHIDLVSRRLLKGEEIPHAEKVFSVFESHTEWISKGKRNPSVELGHRVMITTDENDLIVDYKVMLEEEDSEQPVELINRIVNNFGNDSVQSISFDRGFSSYSNKMHLYPLVNELNMPKKGKKNKEEIKEESAKEFVRLRKKHAAVESNINCLEHHGLNRCPDKGLDGFTRYVGVGILAYNLHKIGNFIVKNKLKKLVAA
jgi:transposase, IS5 family